MAGHLSRVRVWGAVLVVSAIAVSGVSVSTAPAQAAAATAKVATVSTTLGADGKLSVKLTCASTKTCVGTVTAMTASVKNTAAKFTIAAKKSKTLKLALTAKQLQSIHDAAGNKRTVKVTTQTTKPARATHSLTKTVKLTPSATVSQLETKVGSGNTVGFTVACKSTVACKGSAVLTIASKQSSKVTINVAAKKSKAYRVTLSAAQVTALKAANGKQLSAQMSLALTAPMKLTVKGSGKTSIPVTDGGSGGHGGHDGHGDPEDPLSTAYKNSWSPSTYDTCTRAEHETYAVIGPDGKLYPGWHPPVHTREDGSTCSFGHEHGDDPRNSSIYAWVMSQYAAEARDNGRKVTAVDEATGDYLDTATGRKLGLPFGYGSERLNDYSAANPSQAAVHRHEDDPGHKVIVSNDQALGQQFRTATGATVNLECSYLVKMHQGSHSSDATKNNTHELVYAVSCNDGTQTLATTMSQFGNANELFASCTRPFNSTQTIPLAVPTIGSTLPNGTGGKRYIPTQDCIEQYVLNGTQNGTGAQDDLRGTPVAGTIGWWWAGYEQWQSTNTIRKADGTVLAQYEPWFGVQNPARYYVGNGATDTVIGYTNDLAWEAGNQQSWAPWSEQLAANPESAIDKKSPASYFNGAVRDAWLARTLVKNKAGTEVLYADPWGGNAQAKAFPGSMRVVVSSVDNSSYIKSTTPSVTRRFQHTDEGLIRSGASVPSTGLFYDYGTADGASLGVHMPN